jgi:histidinol-phosphate aminotransferase
VFTEHGWRLRPLCPELFFDASVEYARSKGAKVLYAPLKDDFSIDLTAMKAMITPEVALVHICNPNNPTGMVLDGAELRAFCRSVAPTTPVLIDEAYNELTSDPDGFSMIDLVREGQKVIITRTFSKIYGMAGMRVGYAMCNADLMTKFAGYVMPWANVAGLAGAVASYHDETFKSFSKGKILEARAMVLAAADKAGLKYLPSEANFVWIDVGQNAEEVRKRFEAKRVMIRRAYGKYTNWSRVSMGRIEDVRRYVDALPEAVSV